MVMAWLRLNNSTTNEAHIKKACFCKQAILNPGIDTKTGAGCLPVTRYQLYEPQAHLHIFQLDCPTAQGDSPLKSLYLILKRTGIYFKYVAALTVLLKSQPLRHHKCHRPG